jgi:hypothetical protein
MRSDRPSALTTPAVTDVGQRIAGHADDGKVGVRVVAQHLAARDPPIKERDADMAGAMDDVAVGQKKSVGGEQEAGSRPLTRHIHFHDGRTDTVDRLHDGL